MNYFDELKNAMSLLNEQDNVKFLGQSCQYPGTAIYNTVKHLSENKRLEMPVAENMQLGMSIGLAIQGYLSISIFPRFNFLVSAMDQLVHHLDKLHIISAFEYFPKVIIRTSIGSESPLHPGMQHVGDFTSQFKSMLPNMNVVRLDKTEDIVPAYRHALDIKTSSLLVEWADKYNE